MNATVVIVLSGVLAIAVCLVVRQMIARTMEKKAVIALSRTLFPGGEEQKQDVIRNINAITNNRFTCDDVLDFYLKIKGLQIINMNDPVDFWIRNYLMQPTKVRLNYFEQVKFYEAFLNFPEAVGKDVRSRTY